MPHQCRQCGASCEGLRVRVTAKEKEAIASRAETLGIDRPFQGPWLRQNWGRCVFWEDGCRLHATFGALAKPAVCRQFPRVGEDIDPACFHPGEGAPAPELNLPWEDLAVGREVGARLLALPLIAITEHPRMGPQSRELLKGLDRAEPAVPGPEREPLHRRAAVVIRHGLAPQEDLAALLVGGGQLIVGARLPVGPAFAAWTRLLRTGVL